MGPQRFLDVVARDPAAASAARRDQLAECRQFACWREDLGLVRELGLKVLRYGLPYYAVQRGPGRYDWEFASSPTR